MNDIRDLLAENIAILMEESSDLKSQNAAAKRAKTKGLNKGIGQTTLGGLLRSAEERGTAYPKLNTLENIATLFGVTVSQLLTKNLGRQQADYGQRPPLLDSAMQSYVPADPLIAQTVRYMESTNATGRAIVHDKARDMAREHPFAKGNAA